MNVSFEMRNVVTLLPFGVGLGSGGGIIGLTGKTELKGDVTGPEFKPQNYRY